MSTTVATDPLAATSDPAMIRSRGGAPGYGLTPLRETIHAL
jgi:hypothetical protein